MPLLVGVSLAAPACDGPAATEGPTNYSTTSGIEEHATTPTTDPITRGSTSSALGPDDGETTPAPAPGVFFPEHEGGEVPAARAYGRLVLDDEGCIRLKLTKDDSPPVTTPIWPPEYAASAAGGEIRILDGEGRVVARVGDAVRIDGGFLGGSRALGGISGVDERTKSELMERCPGEYFYVAPYIRVVPQGKL